MALNVKRVRLSKLVNSGPEQISIVSTERQNGLHGSLNRIGGNPQQNRAAEKVACPFCLRSFVGNRVLWHDV